MSKLPAFQFYPADWRKDISVQSLSFHDRGVWFEILCLMHESESRGKLLLNGKAMPKEVLSRVLGLDKQLLDQTLGRILEAGVASIDEGNVLVNRRMVRDEEIRQIRKEAGKQGGNPALVKQKDKQKSSKPPSKIEPLHSSSSSSTSETEREEPATQTAPPSKVVDPVSRRIWTDGLDLLKSGGIADHSARSLLGKLGKEYGRELLGECIAATQAANPVNPDEFLIGTLKNRKNRNAYPNKTTRTPNADALASYDQLE